MWLAKYAGVCNLPVIKSHNLSMDSQLKPSSKNELLSDHQTVGDVSGSCKAAQRFSETIADVSSPQNWCCFYSVVLVRRYTLTFPIQEARVGRSFNISCRVM